MTGQKHAQSMYSHEIIFIINIPSINVLCLYVLKKTWSSFGISLLTVYFSRNSSYSQIEARDSPPNIVETWTRSGRTWAVSCLYCLFRLSHNFQPPRSQNESTFICYWAIMVTHSYLFSPSFDILNNKMYH